jgi:outer membrane protein TolC
VFDTDTYLLGFDASWEIDVFGGKRRAFEAAAVNLAAIEDVENALVSHGNERERHRTLGEAVVASQRAVELANQRYTKGVGDFLNVGVAQRALNQAEDDLVDSQRTVSQNLVALYKALGGGWESGTMTSQR